MHTRCPMSCPSRMGRAKRLRAGGRGLSAASGSDTGGDAFGAGRPLAAVEMIRVMHSLDVRAKAAAAAAPGVQLALGAAGKGRGRGRGRPRKHAVALRSGGPVAHGRGGAVAAGELVVPGQAVALQASPVRLPADAHWLPAGTPLAEVLARAKVPHGIAGLALPVVLRGSPSRWERRTP